MDDTRAIEGVILAAGTSSRAGTFKPALPVEGMPMIARAVAGMREVCGRITVVGGHEIGQLRALLETCGPVGCIENSSYRKGMFSSVKAGLAAVRAERCFVLPGDVPLVPPAVYRALLAVDAPVVVPRFRGRGGHPVCLARSVIPQILSAPDDSSLRDVLNTLGCLAVDVDSEEILLDIDTPENYRALLRRQISAAE